MSTLADANSAMRERVTHLERCYGRKRVYLITGFVALLFGLLAIRAITSRQKPTPPPAPRAVAVAKVITKDVPLYLDEIGTCTAAEMVQVQAQVSGQILSRDFEDGADVKKGGSCARIQRAIADAKPCICNLRPSA